MTRIPDIDGRVGERILARRRELRWPQRAVTGPGLSESYVSLIESGKRNPTWPAILAIASALDIDAWWLATGEPDPMADVLEAAAAVVRHANGPGYQAQGRQGAAAEGVTAIAALELALERAGYRWTKEAA